MKISMQINDKNIKNKHKQKKLLIYRGIRTFYLSLQLINHYYSFPPKADHPLAEIINN